MRQISMTFKAARLLHKPDRLLAFTAVPYCLVKQESTASETARTTAAGPAASTQACRAAGTMAVLALSLLCAEGWLQDPMIWVMLGTHSGNHHDCLCNAPGPELAALRLPWRTAPSAPH